MYSDENKPVAMSIAGLDPSGGAGILADAKSFHAHGVYATCVVTTLTSQNPFCVNDVKKVDPGFIEDQIDTIMDVYNIKYVKTGLLYNKEIVKLIQRKIKEYNLLAVVDPVMISESGSNLVGESFACSIKKYLLKYAYIITPNIYEAEQLSGITIENQQDMITVAETLSKNCSCVITGGHMHGNDTLSTDGEIFTIKGKMIDSKNTHGTGCNYSSALTSRLIQGHSIKKSCILANKFIQTSIRNGFFNTPYQFEDKF